MRFLSEGIRRPNFIHEVSRIRVHSQSTFGCSCISRGNVRERDSCGEHGCESGEVEITHGMLEREIAKVRKAKAEHSGEKGKARRRIGFCER